MPKSKSAVLTQVIKKEVQGSIQAFLTRLQEEKNIPLEETTTMWKTLVNKKKTPKKMNCYHLFLKEERPKVVASFPHLSFADTSREIGKRWRSLSSLQQDQFRTRVKLIHQYSTHETWTYYIDYPLPKLRHIAKNWLEDDTEITISDQMSKEEIIGLLIVHGQVEETPVKPLSPTAKKQEEFNLMWRDLDTRTYNELFDMIKQEYPAFSDRSLHNKDDLIRFLIEQNTREEKIPLEVHPYYYTLVSKSMEALRQLCLKNFSRNPGDWEHQSKRQLMELLIRNFDHLSLEEDL